MKFRFLTILAASLAASCTVKDGPRELHIYTTNDIHGHYFDSTYVSSDTQGSLLAVSEFINGERAKYGKDAVILLDDGDIFQGDNAAYYYNYIDTKSPHIYPLMAAYMGYDAVTVGNHDIETGPAVYYRMKKELKMPFLAANAIDGRTGKCKFQEYAVVRRQGLKIVIIGCTNPNMRAWLGEDKLDGMLFMDPMEDGWAQELVDRVRAKEKPDFVIFAIHSGSGNGDASVKENQGLALHSTLKGVDLVVSAHDHSPKVVDTDKTDFVNAGSHCKNVSHTTVNIDIRDGKVMSKDARVENIAIDKNCIDTVMAKTFRKQYLKVKEFSLQEIGFLEMELRTNDAFCGMNPYLNFVHTVCLEATGADICFAAPLRFNGYVRSGKVIYNDLFTIYPYENQLYVLQMTGSEIKDYLEHSYDGWINTVTLNGKDQRVLKIEQKADPRTGASRWSFVNRSYNFDSAAGINYTVDVTKPFGQRVEILSMADGSSFEPEACYKVTTTSYRASGGGGLMKAAGIDDTQPRILERRKEIRNIVYDYFMAHGNVGCNNVSNSELIGSWSFVPEGHALGEMLAKDKELLLSE